MAKNIYFFWDNPKSLPRQYEENIKICTAVHPDYNVELFSLESARKLIKDFDPKLFNIFENVAPPACKSDIFRLVVLYINGGWYLDCDLKVIRRLEYLEYDNMNTVFIRDDSKAPSITNMAIYFQKSSVLIRKMLDVVISYYEGGIYNHDVWSFSGPGIYNLFYNDYSYQKLSFVENFKNAKCSSFISVNSSTSTSWNYQQCFGVYNKSFIPQKFRNSAELSKALDYAIKLKTFSALEPFINVNSGNLNLAYTDEQIRYLSVKCLISIYKETKNRAILSRLLKKVEVCNVEPSSEIFELEPHKIREKAESIELDDKETALFLLYYASILKPHGQLILAKLEEYSKERRYKKLLSEWAS